MRRISFTLVFNLDKLDKVSQNPHIVNFWISEQVNTIPVKLPQPFVLDNYIIEIGLHMKKMEVQLIVSELNTTFRGIFGRIGLTGGAQRDPGDAHSSPEQKWAVTGESEKYRR